MFDEAMSVSENFLDSALVHALNVGLTLEQNLTVFHFLCTRQLVLEKLRAVLIMRTSVPYRCIRYVVCSLWRPAVCRHAIRFSMSCEWT